MSNVIKIDLKLPPKVWLDTPKNRELKSSAKTRRAASRCFATSCFFCCLIPSGIRMMYVAYCLPKPEFRSEAQEKKVDCCYNGVMYTHNIQDGWDLCGLASSIQPCGECVFCEKEDYLEEYLYPDELEQVVYGAPPPRQQKEPSVQLPSIVEPPSST